MLLISPLALALGPYPPAAGQAGSTAIGKDDSRFVAWASGYWTPQYGTDVDATWKTPQKALGKALGDTLDIVCLGNGGSITLWFPQPISDGTGADFAVFENSFSDGFLELAFVEVSSDGVNFFRFPSTSLTASAVGAFSTSMSATNLDGLAGKYRVGYGTPFDLAVLKNSTLLDKHNVRFVRLVDIIGSGTTKDSSGRAIYDPTPVIGSGGFDLEAIGVLNQNNGPVHVLPSTVSDGAFHLQWETNPGSLYRVESSTALGIWTPLETFAGVSNRGLMERVYPLANNSMRFWRIVRRDP